MHFDMKQNTERPNRGWVADLLTVWDGDIEVGYIRCSYIPRENVDEFYPLGVLSFLDKVAGWCGVVEKYLKGGKDYWPHLGEYSEKIDADEARLLCEQRKRQSYEDFLSYFVDKPFEEYISVNEPYRGQGIAEKMILWAVEYYRERGMEFYMSNLRTCRESERVFDKVVKGHNLPWRKFDWNGRGRTKKRYYFPLWKVLDV